MIDLASIDADDAGFLTLVQRIVNGVLLELRIGEAFLVHVDNWFDHKWLRWWSRRNEELRVPTFTPNRIRSEKRVVLKMDGSWEEAELARPLHIRQPGRPWLAQSLDRFSERAAFIWYSGNTANNKVGSLMLYLSGAEGYSWYASFRLDEEWTIHDEFQVTRRELLRFAECGCSPTTA